MTPTGDAEIHIVPYDQAWPRQFAAERRALARTIGGYVTGTIEHVGSTAIPGLVAKPVIDIMVGVASLAASRPAIPLLEPLAYCYYPYRPDEEHWFCKPSPQFRTHHLHLVPFGSRVWVDTLIFRDYLRRLPEVAAAYASLKQRLAERHRYDREAYTDAKAPFIRQTVARALTDPDRARRGSR